MAKKDKEPEMCVSGAWAFEQGMLYEAKVPNSKKAAYLVARWDGMVYMSVREAKEWLARFGDAKSEDDEYARSMLERYVSIATEYAERLDAFRQEYIERTKKQED